MLHDSVEEVAAQPEVEKPPDHPAKTRYNGFASTSFATNSATPSPPKIDASDEDVVPRVPRTCLVVEEQPGLVSVGVVLNLGPGSRDLSIAGRLADGSRAIPVAGLVICCEGRRCGADSDRGGSRSQQRCDVLCHFQGHGGTPSSV
jgi:hypothetical protein